MSEQSSRREFLQHGTRVFCGAGLAALIAPQVHAAGAGFLEGTYWIRCPKCGHNDKVEDITCNHDCSRCGTQSVDEGKAIVVCPDGHGGEENKVEGVTRQHQCQTKLPGGGICGKQARR